jgi:hypothetical protein
MSDPESVENEGFLAELLREEARLLPRLAEVFRFHTDVYREIEEDPNAIPGAFAVVLATSILAGLGQGTIAGIFLGVAGALVVWAFSSALVWVAAIPVLGRTADYAILLRCLGFAYAWNSLAILGFLPLIGILFQWGALGLWGASLVLATEQALGSTRQQAIGICILALGIPVLLLFGVFR